MLSLVTVLVSIWNISWYWRHQCFPVYECLVKLLLSRLLECQIVNMLQLKVFYNVSFPEGERCEVILRIKTFNLLKNLVVVQCKIECLRSNPDSELWVHVSSIPRCLMETSAVTNDNMGFSKVKLGSKTCLLPRSIGKRTCSTSWRPSCVYSI